MRKCREHAAAKGWAVKQEHVYCDEAISGATDSRPELKRMLAAAQPHEFDRVLVDDTSRLSRDVGHNDRIIKQLKFAGVAIDFVGNGFSTDIESAPMLGAIYGGVNEQFLADLGRKTYRGVEGLAKRHLHTGGRCFGYRNVLITDEHERDSHGRPVAHGVRLKIDSDQAKVVRRIFTLYAEGYSVKGIGKLLNREGVLSPQTPKGKIARSWCPAAIRDMLWNDRYRGLVIWGKTKKIRSPQSGRKVYRPRPESDWVKEEIPEQRIISDELWRKVASIREAKAKAYATNKGKGLLNSSSMNSPHLFSGLLKCSVCGANLVIVQGKGRNKASAKYGCPSYHQRGETVCKNAVLVRSDVLEQSLLDGFQKQCWREEVIDYVLEKFEQGLLKSLKGIDRELSQMRRRKAVLKREIDNLVAEVAAGRRSPSIMQAIADRESEISTITEKAVSSTPDSIRAQVANLRVSARAKLRDLRHLLSEDVHVARAALRNHVDKITLTPEGKTVEATGDWKLLGEYPGMVPGARIELATPAFSGRRSTGELPRHTV